MMAAQGTGRVSGGARDHTLPRRRSVSPRLIQLESDAPAEHVFRELVAAYVSATPRIVVHQEGGIRSSTRDVVSSFRERFGARARLDDERGDLVLYGLDPQNPPRLSQLTFRLGECVLDLLRDAGFGNASSAREEDWDERDNLVDALAWEVQRRVTRAWRDPRESGLRERVNPIRWLEASRALERIGDHAVLIAIHGARWIETEPAEAERRLLTEFHHQASDYVDGALVLLVDPRVGSANAALDLGVALRETGRALVDRLIAARSVNPPPPLAVVSLGWALHSLDRIVAYGMDLAEIALDSAQPARPSLHGPPSEDDTGGNESHE
ncbi:MAG: PhoU domain-containing protein [Candidatus Thermoplasmatota archaeon]|nr:PhoU domain-containing protein [Candidatus Thermoplasmatota archaeon]MCL5983183.1 PhoU domain-containing protein [Candidatus Thermoplasmatota archaeon]